MFLTPFSKRKDSGLDLIAALPWPVGIVVGVVAFFVMRYGVGWYFAHQHNPYMDSFGKGASGAIAPLAWIVLALCWIAALVSFLNQRKRRMLFDRQSGIESIRNLHWREFEMMVGEAFRRQGYAVEETGLGGADGGIDLILRRDGRTTLVQCKQWKRRQVDVKTVREMYGLRAHRTQVVLDQFIKLSTCVRETS